MSAVLGHTDLNQTGRVAELFARHVRLTRRELWEGFARNDCCSLETNLIRDPYNIMYNTSIAFKCYSI